MLRLFQNTILEQYVPHSMNLDWSHEGELPVLLEGILVIFP